MLGHARVKARRALLDEFKEHVLAAVASPEDLVSKVIEPYAEAYLVAKNGQSHVGRDVLHVTVAHHSLKKARPKCLKQMDGDESEVDPRSATIANPRSALLVNMLTDLGIARRVVASQKLIRLSCKPDRRSVMAVRDGLVFTLIRKQWLAGVRPHADELDTVSQ